MREVLRSVSSLVSLHQEEPHDHFLFHYQLRITLQVYHTKCFTTEYSKNSVISVSPADYVSVSSQVISFSTGDTSHTVTLSITDDEICEMTDESFSVSISLLSGTAPITILPELAQVAISDTDEPECGESLNSSTKSLHTWGTGCVGRSLTTPVLKAETQGLAYHVLCVMHGIGMV